MTLTATLTTAGLVHPDATVLPWKCSPQIHLFYRPDPVETARRQNASAGRLDTLVHLDMLLALPVGITVPMESLGASERRRVHRLPTGCVDITNGNVTRLAVRPLAVELAVVEGPPAKAFNAATSFAPFCARAVHLTRLPDSKRDMYVAQASFYGVGVTVGDEVLLAPVPHRPKRHTPAGWGFVEDVYEHARSAV